MRSYLKGINSICKNNFCYVLQVDFLGELSAFLLEDWGSPYCVDSDFNHDSVSVLGYSLFFEVVGSFGTWVRYHGFVSKLIIIILFPFLIINHQVQIDF